MNLDIVPIFLTIQKVFFIILSFFYLIFSIIVTKQVSSMVKDIKDKLNPILTSISFVQLVFSIFIIILTLFWL